MPGREGFEDCDDGNQVGGDGCASDCRMERCGNGRVDPGEDCDDANLRNDDECSNACLARSACSAQAEWRFEITPNLWVCMNDAVVETYEDSDALCGASATPATHALVENLREPSVAENQAFWSWYDEREGAPPASYIRTGQKRRGGCTREAYGDLLITRWWDGSERGAWGDLFRGGSSCQAPSSDVANMGRALTGVVCVRGAYAPPAP